MEFSFFIVLITAGFWVLFLTGGALIRLFVRNKGGKRRVPDLTVMFEVAAAILLIAVVLWYAPRANSIWSGLTRIVLQFLDSSEQLKLTRFAEVSYVAQYFRQFYPAVLAVLITLLVQAQIGCKNGSFWYRYLRKLSHWKVVPVIFFWIASLVSVNYNRYDQTAFIGPLLQNMALYFSLLYSVAGFLILVFGLKKRRIPYPLSVMLMYLLLVVSGKYFLFTLVLFMGIGISDIWMSYSKRKFKAAAADE